MTVVLAGRCSEPGSRYLLAQCCLSLGKYAEAEEALAGPMHSMGAASETFAHTPGGAAGQYLLGRICRCWRLSDPFRILSNEAGPALLGTLKPE